MKLRYLIGLDADPGETGAVTVIGYNTEVLPENGDGYINCRVESGGRQPGKMYLPEDDIEREYGEPALVFGSLSFWENFDPQVAKWKRLGANRVEIDNLDTYDVPAVIKMFDACHKQGLGVWIKNAAIVEGDKKRLFEHPAAFGCIVERDCGTPATYDALRKAAGKPNMPIRFVSYGGGKQWAQQIAGTIQAADYTNMGVTYSPRGEYGSVDHVLLPKNSTAEKPMTTGADIIAKARSYIGKLEDGPDVPRIASEIGKTFPEFANYVTEANNGTPWCGIFVAYVLSQFGIKPPPTAGGVGFMWVDTWAKWGSPVPVNQAQPGDVAVFLGNPHHVTFCAGDGRYVGGNQGDAVTEGSYRTPDYVRRAPSANSEPKPTIRQSRITATVWDDEMGAYGPIDHSEPSVSLPAPFPRDALPIVRVYGPSGTADGPVTDKGPWYDGTSARPADRYWETGKRPRAESDPNTNGAAIDLNPAMAEAVGIDGKGLVDWEFVKDAVKPPPDEPDEPVDEPSTNAAVEAALKDVVAALRPILEKHMAPQPVVQQQFDWVAPLVKELLPKLLPALLPYIIQLLPQLLPLLLKGMSSSSEKPSGGMNNPAVVGAGAGGIGAIIGGLLTAFLTGKVPQ